MSNLKLWTTALRSGDYEQGQRWLERNARLCCLGVGCRVAMANGAKITRVEYGKFIRYNESADIPPDEFWEWVGIEPTDSVYVNDERISVVDFLIEMNDHELCSFEQIADRIEENLIGMEKPDGE